MGNRYSIQFAYKEHGNCFYAVWDKYDRVMVSPYLFSIPYGSKEWVEVLTEKQTPSRIVLIVNELNDSWNKYNEAIYDYLTPQLELEFS